MAEKKYLALIRCFTVSLLLTQAYGLSCGTLLPLPEARAAKTTDGEVSGAKAKKTNKSKEQDNDGIDSSVRPFINRGQWSDAIQKLEQLSSNSVCADRNLAWLAFAYLFSGKHNELKELDKKVQAMEPNKSDENCAPIIHAFSLTVQGKFPEAEKTLSELHGSENGDALLEFARACVALKKGNAVQAAESCEKVVGICPNFAWGFRTLGFIQDKSLKNPQLAELAYQKALIAEPNLKEVRSLLVDLKLSKNDFDGAIAVSQEAIRLFPKDASNYYRLAQIYQQQWRLIEALEQLKKAVSLAKDDPRFYRAMASIYRYQSKLPDAISEQQKAVQLSKDKSFELIELANLQELNNTIPAAVESLNAAVKESPSNMIVHQKLVQLLKKEGKKDELIVELKRVVELQPKQETLRLSLAEAYKQAGLLDEAVEQLKEAANLDQRDPKPHREIAKIELETKNYAAAAKSYIRALNINPASVEDLVALGFCYANNNDYMQAETAFTTGLALHQLGQTTGAASTVNPNDIMRSLAAVLFTEGRYREAVLTLEAVVSAEKEGEQKKFDQLMCAEAKALRDRNAEGLKELQASFAAMDRKAQLDNLADYFDNLMKLGKKEIALESIRNFTETELRQQCPLVLASSLIAEDRNKEARDLINKVIDEKKGDSATLASSYVVLAHVMQKDGDKKGAADALQKATETNPKDFDALVELGRLYLSDKKLTEATQSAQKALEVNPYSVSAYLLLADACSAGDKLKDAEANFLKAAELYPTSIDAHKGLLSVYQKQSKTSEAQREQEIINNLSKKG